MSDTEHQDAFITGLDEDLVAPIRTSAKVTRAPELEQVRKDHGKLMGVVRTFGEKVGGMIDKQRFEFMTAYEHHMQDIQNELQSLREKVSEISGEETRKSKLETLDVNQTKFKTEALHLDAETLAQRKQLRKLVNKLHSVERDRDWVFKRLKVAKRTYMELLALKQDAAAREQASYEAGVDRGAGSTAAGMSSEEASVYYAQQRADMDGDVASVSSFESRESNLSVHIKTTHNAKQQGKSSTELKQGLRQLYGVHREHALLSALPHIMPVSLASASKNPHAQTTQALLRSQQGQGQGMPRSASQPQLQLSQYGAGAADSSPTKAALRKSREERDAIGELVALRARQEEIRDFIAQCASSCDKGPWAALPKRGIDELMQACRQVVAETDEAQRAKYENQRDDSSSAGPDPCEERRLLLAMELAAVPEVYYIISDLLTSHDSVKAKEDAMRAATWSATALSHSRAQTEDFPISTASSNAGGREGKSKSKVTMTDDLPTNDKDIAVRSWSAGVTTASTNSNARTGRATNEDSERGEGDGDGDGDGLGTANDRPWSETDEWMSAGKVQSFKEAPGAMLNGEGAGEVDAGQVPVNDWYDPDQPRSATGTGSRPEGNRIRGFYGGMPAGRVDDSQQQQRRQQEQLDLIGGDDLGHWLLAGARQRQAQREKEVRARAPPGSLDDVDDFMAFD